MTEVKKRGGFRKGSGRKKGEPSTVVRVPNGILSEVQGLIESYKSNPEPFKAPKSNPEPFRAVSDGVDPATSNPFFDWDAKAMSAQKRAKARSLRKKKNKKR